MRNFADRNLHDTVYVTANPFVEDISDDVFHNVIYKDLFDQWDENLNTVKPSVVAEYTCEAIQKYPNKRIISHFMQPHAPYIGETGQKLRNNKDFGKFNPNIESIGDFNIASANIPEALRSGLITEKELEKAYIENLELVMDEVYELLRELSGKSVISSDHGELLGERVLGRKRYGHGRFHTKYLREVPWFIPDYSSRRDIKRDEPVGFELMNDRDDRLQALGYRM